jgi:hypothetical protein
MEYGAEGVGQGQDKMGEVPQTIESTKTVRAEKLVVPLSMHDRVLSLGGAF